MWTLRGLPSGQAVKLITERCSLFVGVVDVDQLRSPSRRAACVAVLDGVAVDILLSGDAPCRDATSLRVGCCGGSVRATGSFGESMLRLSNRCDADRREVPGG